MESVLLFLVLESIVLLLLIGALCFKVSSLLVRISDLNQVISQMITAGVSPGALEVARAYERRKQ